MPVIVSPKPTFAIIPHPLSEPLKFLYDIFIRYLIGEKGLAFLLGFLFIAWILPRQKDKTAQILFFCIFILLGLGLVFFSVFLNKYWFLPRQFVWVMPFFAFLLGWTSDSFMQTKFLLDSPINRTLNAVFSVGKTLFMFALFVFSFLFVV